MASGSSSAHSKMRRPRKVEQRHGRGGGAAQQRHARRATRQRQQQRLAAHSPAAPCAHWCVRMARPRASSASQAPSTPSTGSASSRHSTVSARFIRHAARMRAARCRQAQAEMRTILICHRDRYHRVAMFLRARRRSRVPLCRQHGRRTAAVDARVARPGRSGADRRADRPFGLRQDLAAARRRRAGARRAAGASASTAQLLERRRSRRARAAGGAPHRHGVPGLRAVSAPERGRQRRLRRARTCRARRARSAGRSRCSTWSAWADAARRAPHQLSGGQQQRIALARALAPQPAAAAARRALLQPGRGPARAAGPRGARDPEAGTGTTALFVTHDQLEAFALGDVIGVMHARPARAVGRRLHAVPPPGHALRGRLHRPRRVHAGAHRRDRPTAARSCTPARRAGRHRSECPLPERLSRAANATCCCAPTTSCTTTPAR